MSQLQVTGEAKIRDIQGPVVANSGVVTALDGAASQYVRGDGTLADFPTSSGGGSSVSYYLNSSVSQGTIGGVAYRELSKEPIIGAGTDITISSNGYVANYITDVNDPDVTIVAGGNFNCEFYFSVNNNSGNPTTYAELYKYDGTTFTLLGSNVGVPESINQGTTIAPYYFAIPVATAALALTDRLAIRIYVNVSGRTVTLHTENGHLCQVVTTLSKGMVSLNNLTDQSQNLTTGTSGSNFAIVSSGDTHTFNLPVASAANTGKLSSTDWSTFNGKVPYTGATANLDLGAYSLFSASVSANFLYANGASPVGGYISLKQGDATIINIADYNNIYANGTKYVLIANAGTTNYKLASFDLGSLTNNTNRTFTLPDASGTIALTSNIPSNIITGTGNANRISRFNGTGSITDSNIYDEEANAINIFKDAEGITSSIVRIAPVTPTRASILSLTNAGDGEFSVGRQNSAGNSLLVTSLGAYDSVLGHTGTQTLHLVTNSLSRLSISGSGVSTFNGNLIISNAPSNTVGAGNSLYLSGNTGSSYTYLQQGVGQFLIFGFNSSSWNQNLSINSSSGNSIFRGTITASNFTGSSSGTNTGDQNLSAYVPYTGATTNVTLGTNSLTASTLIIDQGAIGLSLRFKQYASASYNTDGYTDIYAVSNNIVGFGLNQGSGNFKGFSFNVANVTSNQSRDLYIPDASGTLALTSNLSAYLPLAGGTLTGALAGTSATFSSSVTAGGAISSDQTDGGVIFTKTAGASVGLFTNTFQIQGSGTKTDLNAYVYGANPFGIWTNGSQKLIVTSGGNVGIGTSAPQYKTQITDTSANTVTNVLALHNGSNAAGTGTGARLLFKLANFESAAETRKFASIEGLSTSDYNEDIALVFKTKGNNQDPTERMRITSGGNVLIGTTTSSISAKVEIDGDMYLKGDGAVFYFKSSTSANIYAWYGASSQIRLYNNTVGVIGYFNDSSGVYVPSSDINRKKDFEESTIGLKEVLQLKPTLYRMKTEDESNSKQLGFIAQDVKNIIPQAYSETGEGKDKFIGLNYNAIIVALTAAIQEQQAQIEELKALIAAK